MTNFPIISIITINYNNAIGLERTINSVVNQTCQEFEYIIIDGGSTDGSKDVIQKYKDKIQESISESDSGIYNAMNKGIKRSKGEYLLFLNSGDELYNLDVLEENYKSIHTEDLIYFNINVIGEKDAFVKKYPSKITFSYLYEDSLPHPATFIKRNLFDKVGLYDENLKIVSDWKFFILALVNHNATYKFINNIFSTFYLDGICSDKENLEQIKKERNEVIKSNFSTLEADIIELNRPKSILEKLRSSKRFKWL